MDLERKGGSIYATSALLNHLNMERLAQDGHEEPLFE